MISPLLAAAALLYGPHTPEAERQQRLSAYFEPKPGSQLELERLSMLENKANPAAMQGRIWLRPPKGQCFIVRAHKDYRDKVVCKPTPLSWSIDDLDGLGHLKLTILIQAEWDEGVALRWDTPYRVGNFVDAGDKENGSYADIVIKSCKASEVDGDRSILLESFEGRRWRINLPPFDTLVRLVNPPIPNLMVNIDSKKNADGSSINKTTDAAKKSKAEDAAKSHDSGHADEHGDKKDAKKAAGGGGSILGALLSKGYKDSEDPQVIYYLPIRGSYKMESGLFTETGSPKGMNGECRYMFKNAPGDPQSGAIECHDTDTLDNVYVHVTCFSQLKERLAPAAAKGQEGKKP